MDLTVTGAVAGAPKAAECGLQSGGCRVALQGIKGFAKTWRLFWLIVCLSSYSQVVTQTNLHSFVKSLVSSRKYAPTDKVGCRRLENADRPSPSPCSHTCHGSPLPSVYAPRTGSHCQLDDTLREERHSVSLLLSAWMLGPPPPPASGKAPSQSHLTSSPPPGSPTPLGLQLCCPLCRLCSLL